MAIIIDRRLDGRNKSAVNRKRFLDKFRNQIRNSVNNVIQSRSITEINKNEKIIIPTQNIDETHFKIGTHGTKETVHPGNKSFIPGDEIPKPAAINNHNPDNSTASNTGSGTDDFVFQISREEFLNVFFDELSLPDLLKKYLGDIKTEKYIRKGFTISGSPRNINILKSMLNATARKIISKNIYRKEIKNLSSKNKFKNQNQIKKLQNKIKNIKFIDDADIRYHNKIIETNPATQAVMFCIMDVSGSMDETKKDIAKRFFTLLYLFLNKNYNKISLVFIRHHTSAKEVTENDFFYSQETGGTVVSSALEMLIALINKKFSTDNWNNDSPQCKNLLEQIMPKIQYFAYVEILPRQHQSLWEEYKKIQLKFPQFAMQSIKKYSEIYLVLEKLFNKAKHEAI